LPFAFSATTIESPTFPVSRRPAATAPLPAVASTASHVAEVLDEVERFVWSRPDVGVLSMSRSWLDAEA